MKGIEAMQAQNFVERRTQSLNMIDKLIACRTDTLVLYSALARQKPYTTEQEVLPLLQRFCQSLIDYTANAHFQLYHYIAERTERRQSIRALADQVYPRISTTTEIILEFNDRYEDSAHSRQHLSHLDKDLSRLGEELADRIELEDQLIGAMRSRAAST